MVGGEVNEGAVTLLLVFGASAILQVQLEAGAYRPGSCPHCTGVFANIALGLLPLSRLLALMLLHGRHCHFLQGHHCHICTGVLAVIVLESSPLHASQEAKLDLIIFNFIEQFILLLLDQLIFTTVQFNFMFIIYFYTVQLNCSEQFILPIDQLMGPRGACSFSPLNERPAELILRLDLSRF